PSNKKGNLLRNGTEDVPLTVIKNSKSDLIYSSACAHIIDLLDGENYRIRKGDLERPVELSDIGILVRSKHEGQKMKEALTKVAIPAITIDDSNILQSREARFLYYLLRAFNESNPSNINKALLSPLTGLKRDDILLFNQETVIRNFKLYGTLWQESGVYTTVISFLNDYDIR